MTSKIDQRITTIENAENKTSAFTIHKEALNIATKAKVDPKLVKTLLAGGDDVIARLNAYDKGGKPVFRELHLRSLSNYFRIKEEHATAAGKPELAEKLSGLRKNLLTARDERDKTVVGTVSKGLDDVEGINDRSVASKVSKALLRPAGRSVASVALNTVSGTGRSISWSIGKIGSGLNALGSGFMGCMRGIGAGLHGLEKIAVHTVAYARGQGGHDAKYAMLTEAYMNQGQYLASLDRAAFVPAGHPELVMGPEVPHEEAQGRMLAFLRTSEGKKFLRTWAQHETTSAFADGKSYQSHHLGSWTNTEFAQSLRGKNLQFALLRQQENFFAGLQAHAEQFPVREELPVQTPVGGGEYVQAGETQEEAAPQQPASPAASLRSDASGGGGEAQPAGPDLAKWFARVRPNQNAGDNGASTSKAGSSEIRPDRGPSLSALFDDESDFEDDMIR